MKQRFRLYRRYRGIYYVHDDKTGKQESLRTRDRAEASALFTAKTQSHRQAHLNLRLARTYLMATDPLADKRTWQMAMEELAGSKRSAWGERWQRAIKEKSFDVIRNMPIIETQAEHFLKVLQVGTVSTNVYLRCIHNFVLDMGWLPCPLLPKRQWPAVRYKEKRAITHEEHLAILRREKSAERRAFYELWAKERININAVTPSYIATQNTKEKNPCFHTFGLFFCRLYCHHPFSLYLGGCVLLFAKLFESGCLKD